MGVGGTWYDLCARQSNVWGSDPARERLAVDVAGWRSAFVVWQAVVRKRELELVRAEQAVLAATGGLGVTQVAGRLPAQAYRDPWQMPS